jgi:hypothetical protein
MINTEEAGLLKRLEDFLSKDKNTKILNIEKDAGGYIVKNYAVSPPKAPSLGEAIAKFLDEAEIGI